MKETFEARGWRKVKSALTAVMIVFSGCTEVPKSSKGSLSATSKNGGSAGDLPPALVFSGYVTGPGRREMLTNEELESILSWQGWTAFDPALENLASQPGKFRLIEPAFSDYAIGIERGGNLISAYSVNPDGSVSGIVWIDGKADIHKRELKKILRKVTDE